MAAHQRSRQSSKAPLAALNAPGEEESDSEFLVAFPGSHTEGPSAVEVEVQGMKNSTEAGQ
eukprot:3606974-Karenia_brevis.AAC.1